ncbi:MAG: hypothetical protein R2702_17520 [Acidimicrobiales bacterium]
MEQVRRAVDGELCGGVEPIGERWRACTVFGGVLGEHDDRAGAVAQVRSEGLASLSEPWTLVERATGDEQPVCLVEVDPGSVTLALDVVLYPGVPTRAIAAADLADGGPWLLRR